VAVAIASAQNLLGTLECESITRADSMRVPTFKAAGEGLEIFSYWHALESVDIVLIIASTLGKLET